MSSVIDVFGGGVPNSEHVWSRPLNFQLQMSSVIDVLGGGVRNSEHDRSRPLNTSCMHGRWKNESLFLVVRLSSDTMNVVIAGRDEMGGFVSIFCSRQVTYWAIHSLTIERSVEVVVRLSSDSINVVIAGRDEKTRIVSLVFVVGRFSQFISIVFCKRVWRLFDANFEEVNVCTS